MKRRKIFLAMMGAVGSISKQAMAKNSGTDNEIVLEKYDPRAIEPEYSVKDGNFTMKKHLALSHATCFGCTTQCGVRVRCDLNEEKILRVSGNPYHPLAAAEHVNMRQSIRQTLENLSALTDQGQLQRASICGRGNAMLELMCSARRIRRPLKRVGSRNSGKWKAISFETLIRELVYGGDLFGEGHVKGLAELRDVKTPIDPKAPELGPKVNQVGVMMSTNDGRDSFSRRFWNKAYGTINYVGHGSWCGGSYRSGSGAVFGNLKKMPHGKPDFANAEFILFIGTAPGQAGNPFKRTAEIISKNRSLNKLTYVVVDPVLNNSQNAQSKNCCRWLGIRPGTDGALIMGMIRWMIENDRINRKYLSFANLSSAQDHGFPSFSSASWCVITEKGHPNYGGYLRGKDIGLPEDQANDMVVLDDRGIPGSARLLRGEAILDVDQVLSCCGKSVRVQSAFNLLKQESYKKTLTQYAQECSLHVEDIEQIAYEFTSHGVRASAVAHGGMMSGNGFYNAFGVVTLNTLIGNINFKGGFVMNGGGFQDSAKGPRYNLAHFPGEIKPRGIPLGRNVSYAKTSEFRQKKQSSEPYPAHDAWFPNAPGLGTEWFASLANGYPYTLKALILWMCNPVYGMPGVRKIAEPILSDPKKLPLIVSVDCFINETNAFADYIVPDTYMYESWGWVAPWNGVPTKTMAARWPVVTPKTELTPEGRSISMETFLIALAKEMKLNGFGENALTDHLGQSLALNEPEDWYFRAAANVAFNTQDKPVEASDEDMLLTGVWRMQDKMKQALKPEEYLAVAGLYTRGGRFEPLEDSTDDVHDSWQRNRFRQPLLIWNEQIGKTRNSLTGEFQCGCATWLEPHFADGTPVRRIYSRQEWPFDLVSFKSTLHSSYSMACSLSALQNTNGIWMHPERAQKLSIKEGMTVLVQTPGSSIQAQVYLDEGINRDTLAIEHGFGHRELGARSVEIDGEKIDAYPDSGNGINLNDLGILDPTRRYNSLWVDPVSGACVRNGIPATVKILE